MNRPTIDDIRQLRKLTGCGMILCKEELTKKTTIDEAINHLREIGSEPNIKGLSNARIDILQNNKVIAKFNTIEELKSSKYTSLNSKIRFVNEVGHYSYTK